MMGVDNGADFDDDAGITAVISEDGDGNKVDAGRNDINNQRKKENKNEWFFIIIIIPINSQKILKEKRKKI